MTDTEKLLERIKSSGLKIYFIAEQCNISYPRLMDRINNKTEFKAGEIAALTRVLNLSKRERDAIFFAS